MSEADNKSETNKEVIMEEQQVSDTPKESSLKKLLRAIVFISFLITVIIILFNPANEIIVIDSLKYYVDAELLNAIGGCSVVLFILSAIIYWPWAIIDFFKRKSKKTGSKSSDSIEGDAKGEESQNGEKKSKRGLFQKPEMPAFMKKPEVPDLLICTKCGSLNVKMIQEQSSSGRDFGAGKACCGYMLLGPLGILCGACGKGRQTETKNYWVCQDCGNKFQQSSMSRWTMTNKQIEQWDRWQKEARQKKAAMEAAALQNGQNPPPNA